MLKCGCTVYSIVVVAGNLLYTTTTSGLCWRLCFGFYGFLQLQTGCGQIRKQTQPRSNKPLSFPILSLVSKKRFFD